MLFWVEGSINAKLVKWIDSVVQVFCILDDFLSAYPVSYEERNIEISGYKCEFIYFSLQLCHIPHTTGSPVRKDSPSSEI